MTIQEAYKKARNLSDKKIINSCVDIGDMWVFTFKSSRFLKDPVMVGGDYGLGYGIHKTTGKIAHFTSNPKDMQYIWNGTSIDIKQFNKHEHEANSRVENFLAKFLSK